MPSLTPAMKLLMDFSILQSRILKRVESQLSVHGLSFSEFMVMHQLMQAPKNTLRRIDLAEQIGLSASGVTRMLMPMEKRKLVKRQVNSRDARVSLVQLTSAGKQLYADALSAYEHSAAAITQALGKPQLEQMSAFIEKLM